MSASCHGEAYFRREKKTRERLVASEPKPFTAGCLQRKIWKNNRHSLTTLKSWIIQSIFWDSTPGAWGSSKQKGGWRFVGSFAFVFCTTDSQCAYGALLSLDVCTPSSQSIRLVIGRFKEWNIDCLCFFSPQLVSVCVCACVFAGRRWLPSWFFSQLDSEETWATSICLVFQLFFAPSRNRKEVTFKSCGRCGKNHVGIIRDFCFLIGIQHAQGACSFQIQSTAWK